MSQNSVLLKIIWIEEKYISVQHVTILAQGKFWILINMELVTFHILSVHRRTYTIFPPSIFLINFGVFFVFY